jgi:(R,R)-butanediol dehydrogenase / meso-butanediol dehydrogenase / diacetyl reductase
MKALRFNVNVPLFIALKFLGAANKKLYYQGRLATVKLVDIPEPVLPGPDWVKIKTHVCGFCASDLNLIFLKDSPTASPFSSFPCVLGHELSGEIIETGGDIKNFKKGDRVTVAPHLSCVTRGIHPVCPACASGRVGNCENVAEGNLAPGMFIGICKDANGGFAPYMVAHESQLFKLPTEIPDEEGAMIEPLSVALQTVLDNRPNPGDQALVIGCGVIGSLVVQSLRAVEPKCKITVSEPSKFHAQLAKKCGADEVITDGDLFGNAVRITGARRYKPMLGKDILMGGFNRIYDCVGNTQTLTLAMRCLAVEGVLSVVGIGHDVKLDLTPLWLKLQNIRGVLGYGFADFEGRRQHVFEAAIGLVADKRVKLNEMMTHKFSIDQYAELIETNMAKQKHQVIKSAVSFQ